MMSYTILCTHNVVFSYMAMIGLKHSLFDQSAIYSRKKCFVTDTECAKILIVFAIPKTLLIKDDIEKRHSKSLCTG